MFEFSIRADHVAALAHLAPDHDVRYYLNYVCLDLRGPRPFLVAGDGDMMGFLPLPEGCYSGTTDQRTVLIPKEVPKGRDLVLQYTLEDGNLTVARDGARVVHKYDPGVYPDWRRILPKDLHPGPQRPATRGVDPLLLTKFVKALQALGLKRGDASKFHQSESRECMVITHPRVPEFLGLCAGFSDKNNEQVLPAWVYGERKA